MAEGAPLLREYVGKTCIEGSNPSGSASKSGPSLVEGFFLPEPRTVRACGRLITKLRPIQTDGSTRILEGPMWLNAQTVCTWRR